MSTIVSDDARSAWYRPAGDFPACSRPGPAHEPTSAEVTPGSFALMPQGWSTLRKYPKQRIASSHMVHRPSQADPRNPPLLRALGRSPRLIGPCTNSLADVQALKSCPQFPNETFTSTTDQGPIGATRRSNTSTHSHLVFDCAASNADASWEVAWRSRVSNTLHSPSAICFAKNGGTAFPTWTYCWVRLPLKK